MKNPASDVGRLPRRSRNTLFRGSETSKFGESGCPLCIGPAQRLTAALGIGIAVAMITAGNAHADLSSDSTGSSASQSAGAARPDQAASARGTSAGGRSAGSASAGAEMPSSRGLEDDAAAGAVSSPHARTSPVTRPAARTPSGGALQRAVQKSASLPRPSVVSKVDNGSAPAHSDVPVAAATPRTAAAIVRSTAIARAIPGVMAAAASGDGTGTPTTAAEFVTAVLGLVRRELENVLASFGTAVSNTVSAAATAFRRWWLPSPPNLSIANSSLAEGNTGTTNMSFTVTLSKTSTSPITVKYATSNGTATAGSDYVAASGTITFAAGQTSKTVTVGVVGDTVVESNETLTVTLSNPSGATISRGAATGTIANDDVTSPPTISIADASRSEGNSGTANMAFIVSLSKASATPVTVRYATSNATAMSGTDYVSTSGTITFAAGETSKTINVSILGDTAVEPDEALTVTLSAPSGATLSRAAATGTITNDDVAPPPVDTGWGTAYFAPYVSMSNWPTPNLVQLSGASGATKMIVGFIQADANGKPSWGGYTLLEPDATNSQAVAINKSIADFQAAGGDAMLSFGGAVGTSLWESYSARGLSAQTLADTYAALADKYHVDHLDFDIEGVALDNQSAVALHSQALKLLQLSRPELQIWYTLPVSPTGLYTNSLWAMDSALKAGVKLAGVNVMAMDYGEYAAPTSGANAQTMGTYVIRSAQSTYTQLSTMYAKYGQSYGWSQLGVTPMLGVNDVVTEIFGVADAQALEDFARTKGMGMISMWSLLRDNPGTLGQVSEAASGLSNPSNSFSDIFRDYGPITQ